MGETICIVCGHRPHAGKCILCFCQARADAQAIARQAVIEARRDEMYVKPGTAACPLCGRSSGEDSWSHGVATKWGDACINTQAD